MPSDYAAVCEANRTEYGNVGRWGRDLLVDRYDSASHFIFEFLQNAEDALRRRKGWNGSREVRFELRTDALRIVHCGKPFSLGDVKGVCGVGETTKDLTDIGRFGIGFKSIYSVTERPEVHSGDENFAIENFAFPTAVAPIARGEDETVFVLPLRTDTPSLYDTIEEGLRRLGPRTLLFLRQIEEIAWSVEGGSRGLYLKGGAEDAGHGNRRVSIIGEVDGQSVDDETWLIFAQEVHRESGEAAGNVEIAFLLERDADNRVAVRRLDSSPLVAFFPTVLPTHLGFLVQGPYRTTPSRDNVPPRDPWNIRLVQVTANLLVDALEALKVDGLLDVAALQSLPLDRRKYADGTMFAPLFKTVHAALSSRPLLPRAGGGWSQAAAARLARTQELRELFDSRQLGSLLGNAGEVHWLTGEITRDTAASLRHYLLYELNVTELTPEQILPRFNRSFLESQSDEWIVRLYEFLAGQPALLRQGKAAAIPLVRLEDGSHVIPEADGQPQAFLPSSIKTDFPTVRRSVCGRTKPLEFLRALGLTEPDAVDDVVRNLLPKYNRDTVDVEDVEYAADIRRILNAFNTQHRGQREKLIAALRETSFVMSVDLGDGQKYISKPGDLYLATERLTALLAGVPGAMVVDDSYDCLRGNAMRDLLEACGASRSLIQVPIGCDLSWQERSELRQAAGCENMSWEEPIQDHTLRCLPELLKLLPTLGTDARRERAQLLWDALKDVEERRGTGAFSATYAWHYYRRRQAIFDPAFVRSLNSTPWVPDSDGELQRPEFVTLESLAWNSHPFLASKITFKKPIIDELAIEAGIEPRVLEILKKRGLTSVDDLIAAIGVGDEPEPATEPSSTARDTSEGAGAAASSPPGSVDDSTKNHVGGTAAPTPGVLDPAGIDPSESVDGHGGDTQHGVGGDSGPAGRTIASPPHGAGKGTERGHGNGSKGAHSNDSGRKRTPGSAGGRPFISYLGTHPSDEEPDPDGLSHDTRMALEAKAIDLILALEPGLERTPPGNRGYDLFEQGEDNRPVRWIEVKAMTGCLQDRPVGMSRPQFECAEEHGDSFWLYVVEHADSPQARVVRIQDPAGRARTFTFDRGWLEVADVTDDYPDGPTIDSIP